MIPPIGSSSTPQPGIPEGSVLAELVKTMEGLKKSGDQFLKIAINGPLEMLKGKLEALEADKIAAMQEVQTASNRLSYWGYGSYISSLLYATSSILGGTLLYYFGDEKGPKFIKVGLLLLGNTVISQGNHWKSLARLISRGNQNVETVLDFALPAAFSFFLHAWNAQNLAELKMEHKDKVAYIERAVMLINVALQMGNIYASFNLSRALMKYDEINNQMTKMNFQVTELMRLKAQNSKTFKALENAFKQMAKDYINSNAEFAKS
jgi:hypothetical protein